MSRGRRAMAVQLGLLVAVFALPVLVSSGLFFFGEGLVPEDSAAMGSLIDPARPLPQPQLFGPAGEPRALDEVLGKWTIVYVARQDCGPSCAARLDDMDKVRRTTTECACYVVEVCNGCAWNHLVKTFPVEGTRAT